MRLRPKTEATRGEASGKDITSARVTITTCPKPENAHVKSLAPRVATLAFLWKANRHSFFFNRKTETLTFVPNISMVVDNCHSSKRHKFVNFRLNFNYLELKLK